MLKKKEVRLMRTCVRKPTPELELSQLLSYQHGQRELVRVLIY